MRNLMILGLITLGVTGCGAVNDSCGSDLRMGCNAIFGELPEDRLENELAKRDQEQSIKDAEQDKKLSELSMSILKVSEEVDGINSKLDTFIVDLGTLETSFEEFGIEVEQLETNLVDAYNTVYSRVDTLESNVQIASIYNPCPNSKEVLIELSTGEFIAYFESGNKRYLSKLDSGNYMTSDGTKCRFTID